MESTDNTKDKITLEVINEKLDSIKSEIKKLPKQEGNERIFVSTILTSLGLVLFTISITLLFQLLFLPEFFKWLMLGI